MSVFKFYKLLVLVIGLVAVFSAQAFQASNAELLKAAISLRQAGQHFQAVEILEQLKSQYQNHKRVNIELAINYINLKKLADAQSAIDHLNQMPLSEMEKEKLVSLQQLVDKSFRPVVKTHFYSVELLAYYGIDSLSPFSLYEYMDFCELEEYEYLEFCEIEAYEYLDFFESEEYEYLDFDDDGGYVEFEEEPENTDSELSDDSFDNIAKNDHSYTSERLRATYRYRPGTRFDFFGQQASFIWYNNLSLNKKQVNDDNESRYSQLKFDSTLYLLQSNRWMFDVRLRGRYHSINGNKLQNDQSIQFAVSMPVHEKARIKAGLEIKNKSFAKFNHHYDANVSTPWLEYSINLNGTFRWAIGGRYRQSDARDPLYTYDNRTFYTSLHYKYSHALSGFVTLNQSQLHYKIDDLEQVNWTEEQIRSAAVGIKYQFNHRLSFGLNSHFIANKQQYVTGKDEWKRFEMFVGYIF
jgi:hypothetical protein